MATIATAVEEQATTTTEISTNVSQAYVGINDINQNMSLSSGVSGEIAKDITSVNNSEKEMSSVSANIKENAEKLSKLSDKLLGMVN